MNKQYNIAILGATGMVGAVILSILAERNFPVKKVFALASERSAGEDVEFGRQTLTVQDAAHFDFSQVTLAFFSAGSEASLKYVPIATAAGCIVIDNTSAYRYDLDVPLIIPEVNLHRLGEVKNRRIIANPNCSTIQMLVALKPLYDAVGITRINVATYQSVSGAGARAAAELAKQTMDLLNGLGESSAKKIFPKQIAFNVLPHIDVFQENGYTKEEMKIVWETKKILEDERIGVNPTTVRVPVFYGHSEAVHLETREPISALQVKDLLRHAPGVCLLEEAEDYPTAITHASGQDPVYVGRVRADLSHPNGMNLWIVADNIRKGAALNSVQIAEALVAQGLV